MTSDSTITVAMTQLTIVIPTYNEADNLQALIEALWRLSIPDLKLLIVDDNSPDGTGEIADSLASSYPDRLFVLHREGKLGLGSAYIQGFTTALAAGAEAIGQMDADFSHSPTYLPEFLTKLNSCDAVIGSRYIPGGSLDERWGIGRVFLSWFGNFYARSILRLPIRDTTGGFRVWKAQTLASMPLDRIRSSGYVFQVEMAYTAHRLGFRLHESPIHFEDRRIGQSKMSFRIQVEAAIRVWLLPYLYRDLRPLGSS
jgi:dolichol-phosphate mannosyltransferase